MGAGDGGARRPGERGDAHLRGHFSRKVAAEHAAAEGRVDFGFGRCLMAADGERLAVRAEADSDEGLDRVKHVVGDHRERFAAKEGLRVERSDSDSDSDSGSGSGSEGGSHA